MFHSEAQSSGNMAERLFSGVDLEVDVDLGAVVELADGLGVALVIVELGVASCPRSKGRGSGRCRPVPRYRFSTACVRVLVRYTIALDDGIILLIEHFAGKQPAELRIFLVESAAGHGEHEQKTHTPRERRA